MIHAALASRYGTEPTTLTGIIKAAEGLTDAGLLRATQAMPSVYHGARTRTYYKATPKGIASLKDAIASATAGWKGKPVNDAAPAAERAPLENEHGWKEKHDKQRCDAQTTPRRDGHR